MNSGFNQSAEFLIFERSALLIDQAAQFIQKKVVASDAVIEII
jgi:hypothetical protein